MERELAEQRALIERQQAAVEALQAEPAHGDADEEATLLHELQGASAGPSAEELARQDPLQLYGYLDVGFSRLFIPEDMEARARSLRRARHLHARPLLHRCLHHGAYKLGSLEPLLYAEITHKPASLGDTSIITGPGVNLHFSPTVQLKPWWP